ncbi:uncharacterized protein KY384_002008 [Bacidia gigantensis]|uniref:uncharacterized protein n=1 Tax=Bacidia gigantensis TaxID=2732470 RepID=UPI001D03CE71|nr:uncharacterized protein KY384_002008 [Bacidia gigantensis]KAG8533225.1 hypothetical protein KY384_002008 [Bacidia gigantensis]
MARPTEARTSSSPTERTERTESLSVPRVFTFPPRSNRSEVSVPFQLARDPDLVVATHPDSWGVEELQQSHNDAISIETNHRQLDASEQLQGSLTESQRFSNTSSPGHRIQRNDRDVVQFSPVNWHPVQRRDTWVKMEEFASETDSEYTSYWRDWFISSRGNEYFCEIDEDYLTDRFNLTGLNAEVQYYQYALDLVTDVFDLDCDDDMREQIEKSARHLYGLVHARYITTIRGLAKMLDKYKKGDFGKCPRVMCQAHPLLPTGLSDVANVQSVKLFCGKCEDLYNPKSSRHASIDGAYFGTSFQNILYQVHPTLVPEKSIARYQPRVFGFKVHAAAALERWQSQKRDEMQDRLKDALGVDKLFKEDYEVDDEMAEDEPGPDGLDAMDGTVPQ